MKTILRTSIKTPSTRKIPAITFVMLPNFSLFLITTYCILKVFFLNISVYFSSLLLFIRLSILFYIAHRERYGLFSVKCAIMTIYVILKLGFRILSSIFYQFISPCSHDSSYLYCNYDILRHFMVLDVIIVAIFHKLFIT